MVLPPSLVYDNQENMMTDETKTETVEETETVTAGAKTKQPKTLEVVVLRAVDGYHHRNAQLTVPNDEYHRGLLKQGNLRELH